jgi:hypothetical protein
VNQPLDEKSPSYDVPLHVKSLLVDATPILQLRNMVCSTSFIEPFGIHHKEERNNNLITLKEIKRINLSVICLCGTYEICVLIFVTVFEVPE